MGEKDIIEELQRRLDKADEINGALLRRINQIEEERPPKDWRIHGSVLPIVFDGGGAIYCDSISGGADYQFGMPRKLSLIQRKADTEGNFKELKGYYQLITVEDELPQSETPDDNKTIECLLCHKFVPKLVWDESCNQPLCPDCAIAPREQKKK